MKNLLLLSALAVCSVIAGCSKSDKTQTYSYSVASVRDVTVRQFRDTTFTVSIDAVYDKGTKENVALSLEYLPAGMTAFPASVSGVPGFTAVFTVQMRAVQKGILPITVLAKGASTGTRKFTFNLMVSASANPCLDQLEGRYVANDGCSPTHGEYNYPTNVTLVSPTGNQVYLPLSFGTVTANISCDNKFSLEPYYYGLTITGGGTYTDDRIIVNYNVAGGTSYSCTTTLTKN